MDKNNQKKRCTMGIILLEAAAFALMIVSIWLNEIFDLPYRLLGAEATPVNWRESLLESFMIFVLAGFVIINTLKMFRRMKYLEGILPICSCCKKIRDEKQRWLPVEVYVSERSGADFSHSLCEECAEKLYPGLTAELEKEKKSDYL